MTIQLNADNNLKISKEYAQKLNGILSGELDKYSENLTRIEVHLSDVNGHKDAKEDKRCLLEARLKGLQPVAVSDTGDNYDLAVDGAIDKLKAMLDSILGRRADN